METWGQLIGAWSWARPCYPAPVYGTKTAKTVKTLFLARFCQGPMAASTFSQMRWESHKLLRYQTSRQLPDLPSEISIRLHIPCSGDSPDSDNVLLQRIPATVPQLVEASPSATEDGALLMGSHRSSVYVVDARTGALLRVLPPYAEGALGNQHSTGAA